MLRAVGGPEYGGVDESAPPALTWRELLAGRRLLVVLDDVDSVEQVRAVLAAPTGCSFILTSRRRLIGLDDAVHLEVHPLDGAAALALLERLIGAERVEAEPETARELIARCAGLPSIIRSVGARLAARPHWSLASAVGHVIETMRTCAAEDGESVVAPLLAAFRGLTDEQAIVLRGAARFDDPWIPVTRAAEATGLPESIVHDVCESLADIHLLRPGVWGTYGFDPAVRELARMPCAES